MKMTDTSVNKKIANKRKLQKYQKGVTFLAHPLESRAHDAVQLGYVDRC